MKIHLIFRAALAALLVVQCSTTTTDDSVTVTDATTTTTSDISTTPSESLSSTQSDVSTTASATTTTTDAVSITSSDIPTVTSATTTTTTADVSATTTTTTVDVSATTTTPTADVSATTTTPTVDVSATTTTTTADVSATTTTTTADVSATTTTTTADVSATTTTTTADVSATKTTSAISTTTISSAVSTTSSDISTVTSATATTTSDLSVTTNASASTTPSDSQPATTSATTSTDTTTVTSVGQSTSTTGSTISTTTSGAATTTTSSSTLATSTTPTNSASDSGSTSTSLQSSTMTSATSPTSASTSSTQSMTTSSSSPISSMTSTSSQGSSTSGTTSGTSTGSQVSSTSSITPSTSSSRTTSMSLTSTGSATSSSSQTKTTMSTPSATTGAFGSTATLTPGGLYYPVYPYYKVMVDGQQYNVTWVSAQSATGRSVRKPYAYPIVSSSSAVQDGAPFGVRPIDYPEGAYACSVTVDGASYTGACSLGGRGGHDHSECNWNYGNSTGNNNGTGNWGNMNGENGTGMGNNTGNGNQNNNGMTKPCTLSLPGFNGTNTQIQNAIQVSTSCLTTNISGLYGQPIVGTYFETLAFYDDTGNFTEMRSTNLTCHGYYTSEVPAIVSSWDFPCKPIGNNMTGPLPPTQDCQISDVPEVQAGPQFTVTKASCSQNVTLNPGKTPYTTTINATCTTYFDTLSGYKVTYYRAPCYNTFPTQVLQPNGTYAWVTVTVGTTCTNQDNSAPTSSVGPAPCTQSINALVNGTYNGTSLQPASCTSYVTPTAAYETYQYTCYQWKAGGGYSPTSCYGTVKQYPGLVSTTYAPCQTSISQHYVGGVLYPSQNVNTTCATYTQFNGQYNYTQTSYMFPCQMGVTFGSTGNSSAVTSYVDATCEGQYNPMNSVNCGNNCGNGGMNSGSMYNGGNGGNNGMNSLWAIRSYMDTKNVTNYFNGSKVMPSAVNAKITVFSYGNESLTLWSYPCIGSLSNDPNGYIAPGTFSVNSTTCVAYQSQLNSSTLYVYPCETTMFCLGDMPRPGLTECKSSGCNTFPGMSQVPYACAGNSSAMCYTTIGWDLCNGSNGDMNSDFRYPSQFSAFNSWLQQWLQEPARGLANGTFYYPSDLFHLDATQSLTPFNVPQSSGHLGFTQGPNDTWTGPFWSDPNVKTGATPIYTFPWPASPNTGNDTSPWSNFPYLPGPPVPAAPNAHLTVDFAKGNWPMPVWPMVPVSQTGSYSNNSNLPWILFPAIPSAADNGTAPPPPVVNTCPSPPSNGTVVFTGSGLVNSNTSTYKVGGSGQATLSLPSYTCTYASLKIFWSIDSNIMPNPQNASAAQTGESPTTSFNYAIQLGTLGTGSHNVTARSVFFDASGLIVASPITTGSFSVNAPLFTASLNVQNATVSSARNLTLDASTSFDSIDPCYFKRYVSSIVYNGCQSTNTGITPYTGRVLVYFTCQTVGKVACPFPIRSTATVDQMFDQTLSTNTSFVAVQAFNDTGNTTLSIVTDVPTYTLVSSVLRDGDYIFNAQIQHRGFAKSAAGAAAEIVVQTTQYYIAQSPLTLAPFNPSAVYIAPAPVTVIPAISASDAVSQLTFAWSLRSSSNNEVQTSATKDNWMIDTSSLTDDLYTASLVTTDTHGNTAKSVVSFSVRTTIPAPTGCSVTPADGLELSTQFTVQCPSVDTLIPGALYFYSYVLNGLTTTIAYPGSANQVMTLPAGPASSGNVVPIYIRAYIPNNLSPSAPQILNVTVRANVITSAADLQNTYASKFTAVDASSIGASMTSFTAQLATLPAGSQDTKDAVAAVASAISTSAATVTDPSIAISMAGAFASLLNVGDLTPETKNQASVALVNIASVLATPGNYPPLSALTSVANAVLSSTVSNSTTSGSQTLQAFKLVGQALANSITAGQNTSLSVPGSDLNVFAATANHIPAGLGSSSILQRRATSGNCAASFGPAIAASVSSLGNSAVITIQANCLTSSPYAIDPSTLRTGSQTLTPSVLSLGVQANGGSWPNALTQNISVTIPTAYNTNTLLRRRSALERRATTYSAECIVWDTSAAQWTTAGCTATSPATGGSSTTCNCNTLGTVSVRVLSRLVAATTTTATTSTITTTTSPTVSATPSPTGTPSESSSGISKGAIAGAVIGSVAGAALIGGLAYYFLKVRG